MNYEPLLRKLASVDTLSEAEVTAAIDLCADQGKVARRRDIISEGDVPTHVHLILSGWAARSHIVPAGARRISAFLLPGDFCDVHVTSLTQMDHAIVAITDCTVAYVPKDKIDTITQSTPVLTRAFWRATLIDEAILRQWLVSSGRRDARERIAHLFCELHVRLRLVGLAIDERFVVPVTQEELGDATGLTAVHVNRVLQQLRSEGLIDLASGDVEILDLPRLRKVAGFDPAYLHLAVADTKL